MDIVEILVLTLSIPGMCLVLLILTCVEEWLGEYTEDGWAFRPADARRPLLLPVRTTTSHIRNIRHQACRRLSRMRRPAITVSRPAASTARPAAAYASSLLPDEPEPAADSAAAAGSRSR